jgi:hypothetical protein
MAQIMRKVFWQRLIAVALLTFLAVTALPAARAEFTLVRRETDHGVGQGRTGLFLPPLEGEVSSMQAPRKHPWRAALETFTINVGVWAFDRYALNDSYSHIGWSSWKKNFQLGFGFDNDAFIMNLFGHPYQGNLYFNAARSMGMNFWESTPYVLGGSLMWELFGENSRPSIDDLTYTTLGGIYLGEFSYRMSSQVLDDSATGGSRFWREFVGLILDPARGVNRLLSGDAWRTSSSNGQTHELMTGNISLGAVFFDEKPDLPKAHSSAAVALDFLYGDWCQCRKSYQPFDLISFDGAVRYGNKLYFQLNTYAPLFAKQSENVKGQRLLFGLFQDYDYIKNEGLELGGVSLTGGVLTNLPLSAKSSFQAVAQAGSMVWGGSNNIYTHLEDRDYNYCFGPVLKLESALSVQGLGALTLRAAHYQLFTVGGAASEADKSHDILTTLKTRVDVHLIRMTGLRFEYTAFFRHTHFDGHPEYTHYYYQVQGDLVIGL